MHDRCDPDPVVWERITTTWAHPRPAPALDATARHFLAAAVRQLAPTAQQVTRVVHVARTIVWVQAQPCLTTAAIAEAWQYQRGRPRSPVLEPTGTEAKGGRDVPPHAV
ncbi:MAG: hypothetical protein HC828_06215 [Blastochloris sp.]|nr:hypothetical protein [Blastochloris sp.]